MLNRSLATCLSTLAFEFPVQLALLSVVNFPCAVSRTPWCLCSHQPSFHEREYWCCLNEGAGEEKLWMRMVWQCFEMPSATRKNIPFSRPPWSRKHLLCYSSRSSTCTTNSWLHYQAKRAFRTCTRTWSMKQWSRRFSCDSSCHFTACLFGNIVRQGEYKIIPMWVILSELIAKIC